MKTLVVYYSNSGNTQEIAGLIAEKMEADIEEIIDTEKRDGPLSVVKNGAHSSMKKSTNIEEPKYDPAAYDLTVICSPIWAWKITPAARAYCRKMKAKLGKTAFVLTSAGKISDKTWSTFDEEGGEPIARLGIPAENRKDGSYKRMIDEFVANLLPV